MFVWPCNMNWLHINYQLWWTDYYLFIKYYSPLHISSLKCSSSGGYSCTHVAYGTVTLYESSWWPVGTQLEWELTVGGRLLVGRRNVYSQCTFVCSSDPRSGCTVKSRSLVACQREEGGSQRLRHCRGKLREIFGEKNTKQDNRQAADLLENTPHDNTTIAV